MAKGTRSLADQLADFEDPTPKDFDPEDIENGGQSSDDDDVETPDENAGREHYQAVGKGKLRKEDPVALGKQYEGAHVSRDALGADSDDDPFAARSDEDSGSEESGSEEGSDLGSEADSEEAGDDDEDELDQGNSDEDDEDESEESEEEAPRPKKSNKSKKSVEISVPTSGDRDELRRLMATDQKSIAATISSAAKADATKGKAVKEQRATFDALLNTRIKLQSGLTAVNSIASLESNERADGDDEMVDEEAIKSAESAALALWSTLEGLRSALADANSKDDSKKRKRPSPTSTTTATASLWERMSELESESLSHRRSILDKWSSKVRGTSAAGPNSRGKLLGAAGRQQTITAVLDAQIATEIGERSSKRARFSDEQEPLYDDGAFYQSLLRDLVEQRMSSSEAMTNGLDLHHLPSRLPIHPVTGMRNDKVKRDVDTRASKGRKMRYTVHEKLQNFMAPDDRASWTTRARDEFFASLLGRTASGVLGEGDESGSEAEDDREEGGLRLFRN
ncbi:hypothetical protein PENANT_c026G09857 [Penicillium antarcticum]|uniref:Protein BFR2 n=1 Tax=Penicillium antarcticum TaxID=416450 RepID=A0A1V6PXV8_9EURO|nr:uncharacterized protein N7508_000062 [Penicillium antarcticum]KAJ5319779.1 hypothetical protein N7508_000062 [Penicillium antarcticum]OQD81567.1 hypothetical protein PENANT_c026G09857 [Penicillium antarcticum]